MTLYNKTYPLWANALALRDIAPLGRNVVYAGNVIRRITVLKIMKDEKWFLGYKGIKKRLNVIKELKKFREDPIVALLNHLEKGKKIDIYADDIYRYCEAYYFFYLSLSRFLPEMSIAVRWSNGPYYVLRYGGKYTKTERKLADKYNEISKYLRYDFQNCILHFRILMDKAIGLSRYFIINNKLPSFTSFDKHKKFFKKLKESNQKYGQFEDYARYIRQETDWFDVPLKMVRDKYLVHVGPKHIRIFGYPSHHEFNLWIIPSKINNEGKLSNELISVSIPRLANDIYKFLIWFSNYGLNCLKK